jgi:hypothetical protein
VIVQPEGRSSDLYLHMLRSGAEVRSRGHIEIRILAHWVQCACCTGHCISLWARPPVATCCSVLIRSRRGSREPGMCEGCVFLFCVFCVCVCIT